MVGSLARALCESFDEETIMIQMNQVARIGIIPVLFILLVAPVIAGELDKSYNPSKKEWLEISIFKLIKDRTDVWKQRIGCNTWVKEEEGTIFITISSANGEESLSEETISRYVKTIKSDVEELIKKYEWSKRLKVFVQYI
jgi:hypothetical protein